ACCVSVSPMTPAPGVLFFRYGATSREHGASQRWRILLMSPIIDHEKRERPVMLPDGTLVRLRPIRSDDGPALVALFGRLSERTIYQRFFTVRRSLPAEWVHLFTHVDYDRRMAIVAERDTKNGPEVAGVVRYDVTEPADTAEIAIVVEDAWQRHGLGTILLHAIMRAGEARGVRTFRASPRPS